MKVCEFKKAAFVEAEKLAPFKATEIPRFAAKGGGYFPSGVYTAAMAAVARSHQIPAQEAQPSGDGAQYIRRPRCYILEDGAVRVDGGGLDRMHFRPAE